MTRSRVTYIAAGLLLGVFIAYSSDQIPAKPQDHSIAIVGRQFTPCPDRPLKRGQFFLTRERSSRSAQA
jgi:hypothetical protein